MPNTFLNTFFLGLVFYMYSTCILHVFVVVLNTFEIHVEYI